MTDNQEMIIKQVIMQTQPGEVIDEEKISNYINIFRMLNPVTDDEVEEIKKDLHTRLLVRMDRGVCIKEKKHISWYYSAKKELKSSVYWDRYSTYLIKYQGFNQDVINSLDASTDEMMDMLENPKSEEPFSRRGLVIGDVQSGKTSTYTALINKAADAGYRIIILLTGTIEKLRRQTQQRLDAGFTGLDSTAFSRDQDQIWVGVGEIDPSVSGWAVTSTSSDFNTKAAKQISGKLSGITDPVLFVLKKNKSVLEKLEQWLRAFNTIPGDKKIHSPMLLIDDEADNASINTKKDDESPTTINKCIRKLLDLFTHTNYVAFTATPYANIFINPDSEDKMLKEDLFPRDFIYALEAPTNYIGARSIFPEAGQYHYMLKSNDDCEFYLPEKHKKDFIPLELPESLKEAVASFFIANAIRDLRGQVRKHRSMLINISRFINVQEEICKSVDGFVRQLQREIKNYGLLGDDALNHNGIAFIKNVFDKHFLSFDDSILNAEKSFSWSEIQCVLYEAVAPIVVRTINGGNASKNLNYDECEEEGLRIIAIGGFSLSRGLTLEGLCVSYFYRNSRMYDTLMQMGRWFGYRPHYADVCQIWMSSRSADWYEYISNASDELRREVKRMRDLDLSPEQFGFGVRSDINALLVTAVNKMRYTEDIPMVISLNGDVIETTYLHMTPEKTCDNFDAVSRWLSDLINDGYSFVDTKEMALKNPQILDVPKERVLDLLEVYNSHYLNLKFRTSDIIGLLKEYNDGTVDNWDVQIANGSGKSILFCGQSIKPTVRSFAIKKNSKALQMSGAGAHLGSANLSKGGLTKKRADEIETSAKALRSELEQDKAFSQEEYFNSGQNRKPLLTIFVVQLKAESKQKDGSYVNDPEKEQLISTLNHYPIGLSIGIPNIDGRAKKTYKYTINLVKWRELLDIEDDDFDEENGLDYIR